MRSVRALQRMGEEIGDHEVARFAALQATVEAEFAALTETADAPHG
jgi:hypothetical protein